MLTLTSSSQYPLNINGSNDGKIVLQGSSNPYIRFKEGSTDKAYIQWSESGYMFIHNQEDSSTIILRDNLGFSPDGGSTIHSIFHAGNLTVGDGGLTQNNFTNADHSKLNGIESGATADQTKSDIDGLGIAASTAATLATARTIAGVSFNGSANISLNNNAITNGAGYITATLTNEQVQDIVGGMVTGNTESGITVTYQDGDGTLDFSVASQTDQNFTTTLKNKLDGIAASATNVTNNNQLTNGAGYITSASFSDVAGGGTFTGDIGVSGGAGAIIVNANSDIRLTSGTWTGDHAGKIQHHNNSLYLQGGTGNTIIFRDANGTDRAYFNGDGDFLPAANNAYTLGNGSNRWQDVFTNDLHLSNEGSSNKVDNSWGDYTIQEGSDDLFLINNRNGKMFKFMLQEVK